MKKFYVVRHAQTDLNVQRRLQGSVNLGLLTEKGKIQALDAGRSLKKIPVKKAFCSPLSRAQETFKIINEELKINEIETIPSLVERSFGVYEGKSLKEVGEISLDDKNALENMHVFHEIEQGESLYDVGKRMFNLIEDLGNTHSEGDYLIITHGNCVTALKWLLGPNKKLSAEYLRAKNCEYIEVVYKSGEITLG